VEEENYVLDLYHSPQKHIAAFNWSIYGGLGAEPPATENVAIFDC